MDAHRISELHRTAAGAGRGRRRPRPCRAYERELPLGSEPFEIQNVRRLLGVCAAQPKHRSERSRRHDPRSTWGLSALCAGRAPTASIEHVDHVQQRAARALVCLRARPNKPPDSWPTPRRQNFAGTAGIVVLEMAFDLVTPGKCFAHIT